MVSNHEIDVKRVTIEQLRASPVVLPNPEPGSPRPEEISAKMRKINANLEELKEFTSETIRAKEFESISQLKEELQVCLKYFFRRFFSSY